MKTYSFGSVPDSVIKQACLEQCPDGYPMTIRSKSEWADAWSLYSDILSTLDIEVI